MKARPAPNRSTRVSLALLLAATAVGGCATLPPEPVGAPGAAAPTPRPAARPAAPPERRAAEPVERRDHPAAAEPGRFVRIEPDPSGSADTQSPAPAASRALLEQSRDERAAGSYAAAASSVERALRIDPNNPLLWLELGGIKLDDRDPAQARIMARKALTLAGGDRAIAARAQRLIDSACALGAC